MKPRTRRRGRPGVPPRPQPSVPGEAVTAQPPERSSGAPSAGPTTTGAPALPGAEPAEPGVGPGRAGPTAIEAFLDRWFVPIALGILLVAAALRLPELALNPFHHDEGVNGFFTKNLVRSNEYAYDPANYHGPSLYYFALVSEILFGLTTEAMRLVPVFFGLLTVALVFPLRRYLGTPAVLTAGLLLAISPGAVYVSRYFIHEMLLVCFSLGLYVSGIAYLDRRKPVHLLTGVVSAALIFTTKETGIIAVVVFLIAAVVADRYVELRDPGRRNRLAVEGAARFVGGPRRPRVPGGAAPRSIWVHGVEYRPASEPAAAAAGRELSPRGRGPRRGAGGETQPGRLFSSTGRPTVVQLAACAVVFASIWVLLFTSFFTNWPKGLRDSVATFTIWTQTGTATQVQPFTKYLEWMAAADAPLLLMGLAGGLLVAWRAKDRRTVFIGLWALGVTLAYSIIQYKTPWIIVNMLLPLGLLAGVLVQELLASRATRRAVPILLGASVLLSGYQAIDLNYNHYADETYPYVFVHTSREMLTLVDQIDQAAARAGTGKETGVVMFTPDYWPLPWYLRDYPKAGFFGRPVDTREAIVIVKTDQEKDLAVSFTEAYARQGEYVLRPGVKLVLYLRRETFGL